MTSIPLVLVPNGGFIITVSNKKLPFGIMNIKYINKLYKKRKKMILLFNEKSLDISHLTKSKSTSMASAFLFANDKALSSISIPTV